MIITIITSITFREYAKLLFTLTYKKPTMILIVCIGLIMTGWIGGYWSGLLPVPEPLIYQYITLSLIAVVQPAFIYSIIRKNYLSSNHLRELLEIIFTEKLIIVKGNSFLTELTWEKTFKVVELTNWFLIYQNNLSAIIIPKRVFAINECDQFKGLLRSIPGLDLHLQ